MWADPPSSGTPESAAEYDRPAIDKDVDAELQAFVDRRRSELGD
jgi:hypothetical protein